MQANDTYKGISSSHSTLVQWAEEKLALSVIASELVDHHLGQLDQEIASLQTEVEVSLICWLSHGHMSVLVQTCRYWCAWDGALLVSLPFNHWLLTLLGLLTESAHAAERGRGGSSGSCLRGHTRRPCRPPKSLA